MGKGFGSWFWVAFKNEEKIESWRADWKRIVGGKGVDSTLDVWSWSLKLAEGKEDHLQGVG